jgi:ABC-type polysaccharide/polyol phosphate transport system ATPase subunit
VTAPLAVRLDGVGKRYVKYEDSPTLLGNALRFRNRTRRSRLWAIRGIDLELTPASSLGVLGRNGSGKSTLLRMLAGVTAPSEGSISVWGRVAPLISVGVGFHPELTGRENVYVNGTVLGMSRGDIDRRFDEIVEFAEIGKFIDTPVKFYSSGMFVRLGFSVAVTADPDVLLVDEVLAVGDLAFQMKCFERMQAIREAGTTIVVVSHNLNAIRRLCTRSIVIHDGRLRHDGDTGTAISLFHDLLAEPRDPQAIDEPHPATVVEAATFTGVDVLGANGERTAHINGHDEVVVRATIRFERDVDDPVFGLLVTSESGVAVYADSTPWRGGGAFRTGDSVTFDARFRAALPTGSYGVELGLRSSDGTINLAKPSPPVLFYVAGRNRVHGVADLDAELAVMTNEPDPA